jgi:hypothetical protein
MQVNRYKFPGLKVSPSARKILMRVFLTLLAVWLVVAGFIWWSMRQPPETFGRVMSRMPGPVPFLLFPFETLWTHARAGSLHIGDQAPDFSLVKLDKSERVQLSEINQKQPVVLVFGSYT